MKAIVKGRKIDKRTTMEMTTSHVDDEGRVWPSGTVYEPLSAGADGGFGYQEITIRGERVTFTSR